MAVFGLAPSIGHLDTTSISFEGQFADGPDHVAAVRLTHGHSKDERPDLKQLVVTLICAYQTQIPLWFEALGGNSSDKASFPNTIEWFVEHLNEAQPFVVVVDSALYSAENVARLAEQVDFITRVPATLNEVKRLYETADVSAMTVSSEDSRYRYQWHRSEYGGVAQRWLLVHSAPAAAAAEAALEGKRQREAQRIESALREHAREHFECEQDARNSLQKLTAKWKWHRLGEVRLERHERYERRGRPRKGDVPDVRFSIHAEAVLGEAVLAAAREREGLIVLATNVLDEARLDAEQMLSDYKAQGTSVERGFRFLNDPMFFAHGLYLQKPSRIIAAMMVMTLCLLVYALAEHHLHSQLAATNETLPDQKGKPTQRLSMRRVFQMFEGIDVLSLDTGQAVTRHMLNMKDVHAQILRLLGPECEKCYAAPG